MRNVFSVLLIVSIATTCLWMLISTFNVKSDEVETEQKNVNRKQIRITLIGDSMTEGACETHGYSAALRILLGLSFNVTNAGRSGMTQLKHGTTALFIRLSY